MQITNSKVVNKIQRLEIRNEKFVNEKYKYNQIIGGEGTQVGLMFTTDANCGFRIVFPTHQTNFIIDTVDKYN